MSNQLEWEHITDFSGGLVSIDEWRAGPTSLRTCTDYYPLAQGGLRAFAKWTVRSKAGIGAGEFPIGYYARGAIPVRSGIPTEQTDYYLCTFNPTTFVPRLYRWDDTADASPPVAWTLIKTFAAGTASPSMCYFVPFWHTADGVFHVYMSLQYVGADQGVWRIRYSDGDCLKVDGTDNPNNLISYQDRLVFACGTSRGSRVKYSDPGTHTFGAANFIDVAPNQRLTGIRWMYPYAGELLIAKEGAPMHRFADEITDPVIYQLVEGHYPVALQQPAALESGIAYMAYRDGIYRTKTATEIERLSAAINPNEIAGDDVRVFDVSLGTLVHWGPWLFTPSGHIWDERVQAWFKTSAFTTPGKFMTADRVVDHGALHVATAGTSFQLLKLDPREDEMAHSRTGTIKTGPRRRDDTRRLKIREVHVTVKTYGVNAVISVTTGNRTMSRTLATAGRQTVRYWFREVDEVLDVEITTDSGSDSVEAPSFERVSIGSLGVGHGR